MTLRSSSIPSDGIMPRAQAFNGFGCNGGNKSPSLSWSGAPKGTQSYIVTVYDPDAPTGSGFWHWSVFNVPASVTSLGEGAPLPHAAVAARNDFSRNAYSGACPPEGQTHTYIFTVYALPQKKLSLTDTASAAMVGFFAHTTALAHASLMVSYHH
jgi:Raf kinase inhibitor-like protein, YbhB/YbcL family